MWGKRLAIGFVAVLLPPLAIVGYFGFEATRREPLAVQEATGHPLLSRESCIACHAPIAAEWRESFHFRSLEGPFWERIRRKRFDRLFDALRVPCRNCHAPANVLDLAAGAHPALRRDDQELGVDCVSCHVSIQGIHGAGQGREAPHEVIEDVRFLDPVRASTSLCASCHEESLPHARTVTAWKESEFGRKGTTCLDCHMPQVRAPSVQGGPPLVRRSHRFPGDKDPEFLRRALNATLELDAERRALVRIRNDRVGHSFPAAGMNWLLVTVTARDPQGEVLGQVERSFGTQEWIPGYLDFWPFQVVSKIPVGETREIGVSLPPGTERVTAEFRYRDWFAVKDRDVVIGTLSLPPPGRQPRDGDPGG